MFTAFLNGRGVEGLAKVAVSAAIGAAIGWTPVDATAARRLEAPRAAEARVVASVQHADLEEIFWICDHAVTAGLVDASERAACGAVTEQLKMEKFGGDFEKMLDWWRANRVVEQEKVDRNEVSDPAER
jgi:hypothetical protein